MNNPMQMIKDFMRFQQSFRGDPKQAVMEMVQSGKVSQKQLNEVQGMAGQFQQMLQGMGRG